MRAIDVAIRELGVKEATGRNDGIPAKRYSRGDELPWCASFIMYCFDAADEDLAIWDSGKGAGIGPKSDFWRLRSVQTMEEYLKGRGCWFGWNITPQRNDIVFFATRGRSDPGRGRHVGIIEEVDGVWIHTIEGNLSNAVRRTKHKIKNNRITGYARVGMQE